MGEPDRPVDWTMASARAHLEQLRRQALLDEAEEAAHGVRYLTVETGDLESADDVTRFEQLSQAAWVGQPGAVTTSSRGGNDYICFRIQGPAADRRVEELAALAQQLDPGWWHVRRAAH